MNQIPVLQNKCIPDFANDIIEIAQPLLKTLEIDNFHYLRGFKDNTFYVLTTEHQFIKEKVKKNQFKPRIPKEILKEKFHYIWECNIKSSSGNRKFSLIEKNSEYFDSFNFYSNREETLNIYLNNLENIEKFKFYFKEKAKKLIEIADANRIFIPNLFENNSNEIDERLLPLSIKRYNLAGKYEGISLTSREIEVLKLFSYGNTVKQTAKLAEISPRTVESYLTNIKNKLRLYSRPEIVKFYFNEIQREI